MEVGIVFLTESKVSLENNPGSDKFYFRNGEAAEKCSTNIVGKIHNVKPTLLLPFQ